MAAGTMSITHEALDAHSQTGAANYLRNMLVANGALEPRDEQLVGLEARNNRTVAEIERPEDRKIVAAFARWHVLHRLRRQAGRNTTARTAIRHARIQVLGAVRLLDWLAANGLELKTATQGDVDRFLAIGPPSCYEARHFVSWTTARKLSAKLEVVSRRPHPGVALDGELRWVILRRLLNDPDIDLADRISGSFVLLYAQPLSRIAVMTLDQITVTPTGVAVRFASAELAMPDRLGALLVAHMATGRTRHVGIGAVPNSWLFPGHLPGRPITASYLGQRLGAFGIDARAARRATQQQLAGEIPAVVLAEMLGVAITTAVAWVHAAGGDWANYAALVTEDNTQC
jgi:hypothetical protein